MKLKYLYLSIFFLLFCKSAFAGHPDLEDYDIEGSVDLAAFLIGSDSSVGNIFYIVIRTTKQCYIQIGGGALSGGISKIDCESIKVIPQIKSYIETGKRPD